MPVDRKLFTLAFSRSRVPNWRCPRCDGGHLRLVPETFHSLNTGDTEANSGGEWFDWDMVEMRFVALVRCDNDECREAASIAGRGRLVEDPDVEAHKMDYSEVFEATYILPSPPTIRVPSECPEAVAAQIVLANVAQWGDPDAAGTHIRAAVERLLDELQIIKTRTTKNGVSRLGLHERIELLKNQRPAEAEALLAAKWIGNAGAHSQEITREDVFDMFDILENVLDQVYGHTGALAQLVKAVNSRKGPTRTSRE